MEKTNQNEMEYMILKKHWIDTWLSQEEMDFLLQACSGPEHKENYSYSLAGNISKSELIRDKDNWFYESVLKKLTERIYYRDWDNYYKYHIEKEEPLPKFELKTLWVNYQKQYEFNPLHDHGGLYSFVIFMKIPTHWEEQHALPISANSNSPLASDFSFIWAGEEAAVRNDYVCTENFPLSLEDEGRMLFFPAWLKHQVYPFYGTEEERVTISGNIDLYDPNRPKMQEVFAGEYKQKENMLKMLENSVQQFKEELKEMKKAGENVE